MGTGSPRSRHLTCRRFVGAKSHFASLGYEKTGTSVKDMLTIFFGAYLKTVPTTMYENLILGDKRGQKPGLARFMELCAKGEIPRVGR